MNKLIIIPLVLMILISIFSIDISGNNNPGNSSDNMANGQIVYGDRGYFYWVYNGETQGYFADANEHAPYDPRNEPDNALILMLGGHSVGRYSDLDSFYDYWSIEDRDNVIHDIFSSNYFWLIILGILSATVVLGVQVFGSGLSEFAQRTAYIGIAWGTIWAFLTVVSSPVILDSSLGVFGTIGYTSLSLMFIIGVVMEVTGGDD